MSQGCPLSTRFLRAPDLVRSQVAQARYEKIERLVIPVVRSGLSVVSIANREMSPRRELPDLCVLQGVLLLLDVMYFADGLARID